MFLFDNANSIWTFLPVITDAGADSSRPTMAVTNLVGLYRDCTAITVLWFLPGVQVRMFFECVESHKCFVAYLAPIWSLASVLAHVDPPGAVHSETAVAHVTVVWPFACVSAHVLQQRVGQPEGPATHLALVRLLARMQQVVGPERAPVPCLERAQQAGILGGLLDVLDRLDGNDALPITVRVLLSYVHGPVA